MGYFMGGVAILLLGFGFLQFSRLFSLYKAQPGDGAPWPYWTLRGLGFFCLAAGMAILVYSFRRL